MTGSPKSGDTTFLLLLQTPSSFSDSIIVWQAPFWKSSTPSSAWGLSQHKHVFYNLETTSSNPDSPKYHNYDQLSKQSLTLHLNFFDTTEERERGHVLSCFDRAWWHFQNCTQLPTRRQPAIHHRSRDLLCYKQPPPVSVVVVGATCNLLPGYPPTCADATIILL